MTTEEAVVEVDENEQITQRRQKLSALREKSTISRGYRTSLANASGSLYPFLADWSFCTPETLINITENH